MSSTQLNIVKKSRLIQTLYGDTSVKFDLMGITPIPVTTRGQIFLTIADRLVPFQVVRDVEFSFKGDAILGSPLLSDGKADISYKDTALKIGDLTIPFSQGEFKQISPRCEKLDYARIANFRTVPVNLSECFKIAKPTSLSNPVIEPQLIHFTKPARITHCNRSQPRSEITDKTLNNVDLNHLDEYKRDNVVTLGNQNTDLSHERDALCAPNTVRQTVELTDPITVKSKLPHYPQCPDKMIDWKVNQPYLDPGNFNDDMSASLAAIVPEKRKHIPQLKPATNPEETSDKSKTEDAVFKKPLLITRNQTK